MPYEAFSVYVRSVEMFCQALDFTRDTAKTYNLSQSARLTDFVNLLKEKYVIVFPSLSTNTDYQNRFVPKDRRLLENCFAAKYSYSRPGENYLLSRSAHGIQNKQFLVYLFYYLGAACRR